MQEGEEDRRDGITSKNGVLRFPEGSRRQRKGARMSQSVEALYFMTKLYTSSVRVRVLPGTKY